MGFRMLRCKPSRSKRLPELQPDGEVPEVHAAVAGRAGVPADGRQLVKAAHHLAKVRREDVAKAGAQVVRHLDEEVAVAAR